MGQIFENLAFSVKKRARRGIPFCAPQLSFVFNKGSMGVGLWAGERRQRAGARSAPIAVIAGNRKCKTWPVMNTDETDQKSVDP